MKRYSYRSGRRLRSGARIFGLGLVLIGGVVILYVFFPVLSFYIYLSSAFAATTFESPVPDRFVIKNEVKIGDLLTQSASSITHDYTDARNWFPELPAEDMEQIEKMPQGKVTKYTLSIPKIEIEDAEVSSEDVDLSSHLVQYFTTSDNPTKNGTSVIFGHSTLPQLFDKDNYKTIFANAHNLKTGDEFFITVHGKKYTYRIFSINITTPEDPNIFSQSFDNSYITLVTCTPPGTVWKRLIIRASLVAV